MDLCEGQARAVLAAAGLVPYPSRRGAGKALALGRHLARRAADGTVQTYRPDRVERRLRTNLGIRSRLRRVERVAWSAGHDDPDRPPGHAFSFLERVGRARRDSDRNSRRPQAALSDAGPPNRGPIGGNWVSRGQRSAGTRDLLSVRRDRTGRTTAVRGHGLGYTMNPFDRVTVRDTGGVYPAASITERLRLKSRGITRSAVWSRRPGLNGATCHRFGPEACLTDSYKGASPLVISPRRGHTPFESPSGRPFNEECPSYKARYGAGDPD